MDGLVEGPANSPGFWLWHTTLRWQREVAAALAPYDLTHPQFVLLSCAWWLNEQGAVPNQQELSAQAGTDVRTTSQVVRKLEAKGLLDRTTDPDDTRARRLRITPRGTALARAAVPTVEAVDRAFFAPAAHGTPALDGDGLSRLLRRLVDAP
ncbi:MULTISPECIES: MarR family transcriptional regulator [Kitasatospora]|uniref:Putative MarR family transcriptional regulator n=1 Tax=Kitasatospora setae (strain ATCC 33774 / DSM 43861 / JCM 3304 / KCC A-0304 / NBRC 14216 / KM-6054) TaxID=452652 RepID=E4NDY9_KITSK|nr:MULTISPECIES: MarR family transcriptional regulator [Kitasatospora]BAJ29420.1 putative MarR family transcriptional regulator [Kitasatospora setae KM-6054]